MSHDARSPEGLEGLELAELVRDAAPLAPPIAPPAWEPAASPAPSLAFGAAA
jgi:hypothetical protein